MFPSPSPVFSTNFQQKQLKIEDLIEREQIVLDDKNISSHLLNKRVLVTGAAGSIGSELARQIALYNPSELILVDLVETNLVNLETKLRRWFGKALNLNIQFADITNYEDIKGIFKATRPQIVYHTAALKHVPFVEKFPCAAVRINVTGTKILTDLSMQMEVEKFVFVSSDKAVNPANIMGATKRFGELMMRSKNLVLPSRTKFICARFGNVFGSSGSVIPAFDEQLCAERKLHVTHPDVERYFMTAFEAGQLLLESGAMGEDGQVLIFDMGKPIRIYDLAIQLIRLHDLEPLIDVPIIFTGLRPGEKLYEELLGENDLLLPSHHERIMISSLEGSSPTDIEKCTALLEKASSYENRYRIRTLLKMAIPEFVTNDYVLGSR